MNSICLRNVITSCFKNYTAQINITRKYASKKRFYKKTGILQSDSNFEVTLDQRKLKTPTGKPFIIKNEPLALAISAEWDAQKDKIQQSNMHLTALYSTCLDNPNKLNKLDIVQYLVNHLHTDTILFHSSENDDLYKFQEQEWDPIITWFCDRFKVNFEKTRSMEAPVFDQDSKNIIHRHLMSYNFESLIAYMFGVDATKSVILTLACVERFISPERAILLSRLEEEYQLNFWGRVEWAHELSQQDLQCRMAAAILFIHLNSSSVFVKAKNIT